MVHCQYDSRSIQFGGLCMQFTLKGVRQPYAIAPQSISDSLQAAKAIRLPIGIQFYFSRFLFCMQQVNSFFILPKDLLSIRVELKRGK